MERLTRRIEEVNRTIATMYRQHLIEFDHESTNDGNAIICKGFEIANAIAKSLAQGYSPDYGVRIGCDTNSIGTLQRGRVSRRAAGRAFQYAARMMGFFGEIEKTPQAWIAGEGKLHPSEPPGRQRSYVVLSEEAFRLAVEENGSELLRDYIELPGLYKPRVSGAIRRKVYFRVFGGTA